MKRILFGLFSLLITSSIYGQSTASAGAGSSGAPGTAVWSNPGNITASDDSYASSTNGTTETITASNFGFAIPTNSVIDGIEVNIERFGRASNTIGQGTWQTSTAPDFAGTDVYNTVTHSNILTGAGNNRLMLVVIGIENVDNTPTLDTDLDPVTVTYNGMAMTQITLATLTSATTRNWIGMYYLLEADLPASGTSADLIVTKTRGATATVEDSDEYVEMVSVNTFTNVNQAFPVSSIEEIANGAATITAPSALDVRIGDMLVTGATGNSSGNPYNATGAGYTVQTNVCRNNPPTTTGACMSVGTRSITTTGVGTVTPTATATGNHGRLALVGIVLQGARVFDNVVQLNKAGTATGTNFGNGAASLNVSWPETDAVTTYGDATELWGTTWTVAEINDANFGISLQADATNAQAFIDHIEITVYFSTVMPIDLISFEANYEEKLVKCKATVYIDDKNNYTVITERSKDGITFHPIGQHDFNLGYPSLHHLETSDTEPYTGLSYYRLKLIDHHAETSRYSKARAVFTGMPEIMTWQVYPNPAQEVLVVEIPNYEGQVAFQLYDVMGKAIPFQSSKQSEGRFLLSPRDVQWENGVYILKAILRDQQLEVRFIVQK